MAISYEPEKDGAEREVLMKAIKKCAHQNHCFGKLESTAAKSTRRELTMAHRLALNVMMGSSENVAFLLALGADPLQSVNGKTAYQLARAYGREDVLELFQDFLPQPKRKSRASK